MLTHVLGCRNLDGNTLAATPEGTLSPALSQLAYLQTLSIQNTELVGNLSETWAYSGVFQNLTLLTLVNNSLLGL